jgi:Ca2+-binding EF-hand superfamily protein
MATSSLFNDTNELQQNGIVEFGHAGGVANGTAVLGGILTWEDNAWSDTWDCDGGLALVAPLDWDDFVASGDNDPHNYTSWGIELTGADSYYTENAPEGEWVVTAGLSCTDDAGVLRSAGGQFGDVHEDPPTVNLTNGTTIGDVSFTLIEHGEGPPSAEQFLEMFDADDSGDLSLQEIIDGINAFNEEDGEPPLSDEEEVWFEDAFNESDYDGDGLLDLDETEYFIDLMDDGGNDGPTFVCGDGEEIPFNWVNDGYEDCSDGSDEPQDFDDDGVTDNWFDCHDGTNISMDYVNDGNDDCPDGEDEGDANLTDAYEIMEMIDSNDDGYLSLQEILDFANEMEYEENGTDISQSEEDLITDAFTYADYDENGLLDLDEIGPFIDWMEEAEGSNGGDDGPDCDRLMEISFQQNADGTANLAFTTTCSFDLDASIEMISYMDSDGDGVLSTAEIAAAQDAMDAEQTCYEADGTEVPCGDDDDDGLFSYDGVVMVTQPVMGDDSMAISVELGIVTLSSTEVITVSSDASLYSHLFEYDAGALWDGGNEECSGGLDITATSPWSVGDVSFSPASDWESAMYADGTGWHVSNFDADEDGHCNSQPSNVEIKFTTPEPALVDTAPTCEIYYNVGGVVLTANSIWSVQIQGAVSFEVPSDGDFTLALPVGEYSVILACNDAEGDAIVVSGTNGNDTWGGTAQDGMIYSEGLFNIIDSDVDESVDITLTWSSTEFNGTFNTHFTAVESVTDALDVTDTGALPGFTSMISITAMLGAAMILARRKD